MVLMTVAINVSPARIHPTGPAAAAAEPPIAVNADVIPLIPRAAEPALEAMPVKTSPTLSPVDSESSAKASPTPFAVVIAEVNPKTADVAFEIAVIVDFNLASFKMSPKGTLGSFLPPSEGVSGRGCPAFEALCLSASIILTNFS